MAKKQAEAKPEVVTPEEQATAAPVENKQAEDTKLSTAITPSADMKAAAVKEEVVPVSKLDPIIADCVEKGDKPKKALNKGEVYLGKGTVMVNS